MIYPEGSVTMDQSGWQFNVKQDGQTTYEDSGAYRASTSSLTTDVEEVRHTVQLLGSQTKTHITHVTFS